MDIKLVFNLDQIGGKITNNNNTIFCDQDLGGLPDNNAASAAVTQQLRNCTHLYSPLLTAVDPAEDTDYISFEEKGEVITGFFEKIRSNLPHTANDTFANTDPVYIFNVGKASVGALQHFAVAASSLSKTEESMVENSLESVKIYPNPVRDTLNIELPSDIRNFNFEITDLSGKSLLTTENETKINISMLKKGAYLGIIKSRDKTAVRKILVK